MFCDISGGSQFFCKDDLSPYVGEEISFLQTDRDLLKSGSTFPKNDSFFPCDDDVSTLAPLSPYANSETLSSLSAFMDTSAFISTPNAFLPAPERADLQASSISLAPTPPAANPNPSFSVLGGNIFIPTAQAVTSAEPTTTSSSFPTSLYTYNQVYASTNLNVKSPGIPTQTSEQSSLPVKSDALQQTCEFSDCTREPHALSNTQDNLGTQIQPNSRQYCRCCHSLLNRQLKRTGRPKIDRSNTQCGKCGVRFHAYMKSSHRIVLHARCSFMCASYRRG